MNFFVSGWKSFKQLVGIEKIEKPPTTAKDINVVFGSVNAHVYPADIASIVNSYIFCPGLINSEMQRIFEAEAWASPFQQPDHVTFEARFITHVTDLTIPENAPFSAIAAQINKMRSLHTVRVLHVAEIDEKNKESVRFYEKELKSRPGIKHLLFETVSQEELDAAVGTSLESLSVAKLIGHKTGVESIITRSIGLRSLTMNMADLTDSELKAICDKCHSIEVLNVADNSLTSRAVDVIPTLPALRELDLRGCELSPDDLQKLINKCPNLRKITIGRCGWKDRPAENPRVYIKFEKVEIPRHQDFTRVQEAAKKSRPNLVIQIEHNIEWSGYPLGDSFTP